VLGIPESPSSQGSVSVPTGNTLLTASTSETPNGVDKAAGDGPLSLGSVPGSASAIIPIYPARAEAEGREGTVVALVTTDTLGRVVDWKIEKSAGREFDESVRRAVLSTRYQVPVRDGRPQAVVFRLPYRFRLE
jgi:TonB family protein